ncbi:vancomycin resistance protein VanW [Clostridium cavendishii DSM 21758]|uniref:Vancomycin resistance protein VanW n=1 Tax=Clostridium cavendishii DSM 21758 TaxID=1121302 RepID=A0A1M6NKX1_9CLOT|nr:VanW family protein [Clostridium cavendishii]SHJ96333.1 vancomycin resistance protein VanW [Clostridium cavendishii DSM 21758]
MRRKLFCEICPLFYKISVKKERFKRYFKWIVDNNKYACEKSADKLPVLLYSHNSLIRRRLGNVDIKLQENKATNLKLSAPKITGILIKPGETFSFWKVVGCCSQKKGYLEGLTIKNGTTAKGVGGGMCQFTNLIHWMILHSPLEIVEHHHHNQFDLFPDFNRVIPFGTGTSIVYNYLDYCFKNNTENTYQLITYVTETHLCGELRALKQEAKAYHIIEKDLYFNEEDGKYYRNNKIYRKVINKVTGNIEKEELIISNHSEVLYDSNFIKPELIKSNTNKDVSKQIEKII